ncbi:GumC family protein [Acetobacter conturbans]|nr:polysaccharide biosynthesis tyrosine autokinase [Acetobacter conturbans]
MAAATVVVTAPVSDPLQPPSQTSRTLEDDELPTQAALIASRDVAALVLKELPPVPPKKAHDWRHALCSHGFKFGCNTGTETTSNSAGEIDRQIDGLLASVTVEPLPNSRVISVSVKADNGERAAALANSFVTNYQKLALTQQRIDLQREAEWLDSRTAELRQRWLEAERGASAYNVKHGLVNTSGGSPLVEHQISDMAASLGEAQTRYAAAQAQVSALKSAMQTGDPQTMLSLGQQPLVTAAATELMQAETSRAQKAGSFGPKHPDVLALDQQIALARTNLSVAIRRALMSINGELVAAKANVDQLNADLDRLQVQAGKQSGPQAEYRTLDQESQSARSVYEAFLDRAKQLTDRVALLQPPVMFVSHAAVPASATFPNRQKLMIGVFVVALVGGVSAIVLRAAFSSGFVDIDEVRGFCGLPLLGIFPRLRGERKLSPSSLVREHPFALTSEAARELGAQLTLASNYRSGETRIVAITSALPEDGKMTLAAWLASSAIEAGETTLVIDADFGRNAGNPKNRHGNTKGFSDVLEGEVAARNVIVRNDSWGGDFMTAGTPRGYMFDRTEISQIQDLFRDLSRSYQLIVVVAPPLGVVAGGLTLAAIADQTIFVCRWGRTSREVVSACVERLRLYGARLAGFVVTGTEPKSFNLLCGAHLTRKESRLIAQRRQA